MKRSKATFLRNIYLSLLLIYAACLPAFAGGPIWVCEAGQAFVWPAGGKNIPFNPDQGGLGPLNHAEAVSLVQAASDVWGAVPTATANYFNAGGLPVDVDATNFWRYLFALAPDGLNPIVFDETGEIFEMLFGPSSGVLGFAGPEWGYPSNCEILEGLVFLNGPRFFDATYALGVMVHEFGHFTGLGHTVVNGQAYFLPSESSGPTPHNTFGFPVVTDVETMYPFASYFQYSLHADDVAIISTLYPRPNFFATTRTISGSILATDGTTALTGVNVIARNIVDPFNDAVSAISGDFSVVPGDPFTGTYTINGLTPGAEYAVFIDEVLRGSFSTPTISPLPGPEEFYNGTNESSNALGEVADDPSEFVPVRAKPGNSTSGIDIIFNTLQLLSMAADDGTDTVTVFQAATTTVIAGTVPVGPGYVGDCSVSMDRGLGFVTDTQSRVWVVDLTPSRPGLAEGINPIPISNLGLDTSISPDQRFLVVCAGTGVEPISVVDIATRTEIGTFSLDSTCNSVDICTDGSVLVTSWTEGAVRRLALDGSGSLTDTGEFLSVDGPMNVYCAPDSRSGVVVRWDLGEIQSFTVPGLSLVDVRPLTGRYGISGLINQEGKRVYVRSNQNILWGPGDIGPAELDVFEYDSVNAELGAASLFTVSIGSTFQFFGMDQMALNAERSALYVSEPGAVNVYEAASGTLIESITDPNFVQPTGICVPARPPYGPNGGFVTGGGWIDSPPGAYIPDETLTGKASFGFVAKYTKGADVPEGQTEFQFKVGDLNFHSASYEWLVVAGPRAQFSGDGTINGSSNFGFMLTAIDGQIDGGGEVDKFRIKIWDKDSGDLIVYDNQIGDVDSANPSTQLGGGSIVIHTDKK